MLDPSNLVFTKCAENLENGRRLENFSWRLWYREAHFFDPGARTAGQKSVPINGKPGSLPSPSLSETDSVQSLSSEDLCTSAQSDISSGSPDDQRRLAVKHLSPDSFKCLVESLEPANREAEKWKAMKASRAQTSQSVVPVTTPKQIPSMPTDIPTRPRTVSDPPTSLNCVSAQSLQRVSSSIVRGFTPDHPSISRRLAPAEQDRDTGRKPKFFLAGSASESDDEYIKPAVKSNISPLMKSNIAPPMKSNLSPPAMKRAVSCSGSVKKTHFDEVVDTKIVAREDWEDEDEDEDEDDSSAVVSDDDDEEWEDSQSDTEQSIHNVDNSLFQKKDTQLTSHPSMLSNLFKSKSDYNLQLHRTPARNRSPRSPIPTPPTGLLLPQSQLSALIHPALAQPIPASPRSTRRKMLSSELSESLRRDLLWERQNRTVTGTAALKRRHTSNDIARLKEFPDPGGETEEGTFEQNDVVW
jgi:Protein of unknown function (DUF3295)/Fungal protein of unknown function (DUF1752)